MGPEDEDLLDILDATAWNSVRERLPDWEPDLAETTIDRDLRGFDLRDANLRGTDLSEAGGLHKADLGGAEYDGDTSWPDGFDFEWTGAVLFQPDESPDVFLSYADADAALALAMGNALSEEGARVFMAEVSLAAGDDWHESIRAAITDAEYVMVLLTPSSVGRPWLMFEAGAAWALEKALIPVCSDIEAAEVPEPLKRFHVSRLTATDKRTIRQWARDWVSEE